MKKILVVLTGGTIGSRVEGKSIDVTGASVYSLMNLYGEIYGGIEEFEVINPLSVLSENMNLTTWTSLCQVMWNISYEDYAGVIVTHGSDTLSYTSALLGMLLSHVPVPVALTASNYPLGEKGSNGLINFRSAVELIRTRLLKGVFTVYRNEGGENNVYLSTRIMEADPYRDAFGSFGGVPFGKMKEGAFVYYDSPVNPSIDQVNENRSPITMSCPEFSRQVLLIRPYPGLDYRFINLNIKPAAALHYLYHSATACTVGEGESLPAFIERCSGEQIPVYTASYKNVRGRNYVTAGAVLEKGAVPIQNISPEAAYAKLLLLYNIGGDIKKKIDESIFFETIPVIPGLESDI